MPRFRPSITTLLLSAVLLGGGSVSSAQDTAKTFFVRRDAYVVAGAVAASAAFSYFDVRIAHWFQQPSVQGSSGRTDAMESLTWLNEMPLTVGALGTWIAGRVTHSPTLTEVGLHATQAMVLTVVVSEAIRIPVGRKRPRESQENAYDFKFGKGLTDFAYRSYPSLHAAAAFAAASSISAEMREHDVKARVWVTPILYSVALVPGFTRLYLNQHWASDVVSGMVLGQLIGSRVVRYAHTHDPTRLDRFLLGLSVGPSEEGVRVGFALQVR